MTKKKAGPVEAIAIDKTVKDTLGRLIAASAPASLRGQDRNTVLNLREACLIYVARSDRYVNMHSSTNRR